MPNQPDIDDLGSLLGSPDAVVSTATTLSRAAVLREVLPRDPFEHLVIAHIPEPLVLLPYDPTPRGVNGRHAPVPPAPEWQALVIVRAYLGAIKAAKLKPTMWAAYQRREGYPDITKSKAYPALCSLAATFVETQIAPASWAAFRLDVLKHAHEDATAKGKTEAPFKAPSLPVLMSQAWLKEPKRRGWYRRDYANRGWSHRVVKTQAHTQLMQLWAALQADLDACAVLTPETARAALERRFPDGLLPTLIERASGEARERQAHYNALAASGEWLW